MSSGIYNEGYFWVGLHRIPFVVHYKEKKFTNTKGIMSEGVEITYTMEALLAVSWSNVKRINKIRKQMDKRLTKILEKFADNDSFEASFIDKDKYIRVRELDYPPAFRFKYRGIITAYY